jgi:Na+/H+ antiporter NhaD/arsenite permease-like protein
MDLTTFTAVVFGLVYLYIIFARRYVLGALWIGIGMLAVVPIFFGERPLLNPGDLFRLDVRGGWAAINWNVIGIFGGTLLVAEVFIYSRMPSVMSDWLIDKTPNVGWAILGVCVLSSFLSMFIENVATVLIVAPVAIELARKLNTSPAPFLISIAITSNLQGAATLIGDPPSMMLAAYYNMNFNQFFWHNGRPGIFFFIQAGALASFTVLWLMFRKYKQPLGDMPVCKPRSWFPTILLAVMTAALALASLVDEDFVWFGGAACMLCGFVGVGWLYARERSAALRVLRTYDWGTMLFLMGVFLMVHGMVETNIVKTAAHWVAGVTGRSPLGTFVLIVCFSLALSAFVDNVPYIAAMLPLVYELEKLGVGSNMLLPYGLLIGACLGGNITPVGASANVVAYGMLRRMGEETSFLRFVKVGLPFTLAATAGGSIVAWIVCMGL